MPAYGSSYQSARSSGSRSSAQVIVPLIVQRFAPTSVVDVGCGLGAWLAAFANEGVHDLVGLDGDWVDPERVAHGFTFRTTDLREPLRLERRFDIALCVEVAEHLPSTRSESLVADLVALAPVVVFSAAVPGQGGRGHINERWQSAWAREFTRHGYRPLDEIRARVWNQPTVEWWYAQNIIAYAAPDVRGGRPVAVSNPSLDVVHPRALADARLGKLSSERLIRGGRRRLGVLRSKLSRARA